jgi:hypothetical protein
MSKEYIYSLETTPLGLNKKTRLRLPITLVEKAVRFFFSPMERIRHFLKTDSYEVEAVLRKPSTYDHCFTGCPKLPEMEEGFEIDGSTFQVHIH